MTALSFLMQIEPVQELDRGTEQVQPDGANIDILAAPVKKTATRRKRIGKREFSKKLRDENTELREMIAELEQQILSIEAQNAILQEQLKFFSQQIQAKMPESFQPKENI